MKKFLCLVLCLLLVLSFSSCAQKNGTVRIGVLKGPTGLGASYLMEQNENGKSLNSYDFTVAGAADELTGRLLSGDLDIAALPTNAISVLYNKSGGEVVSLGVNTLGVLYILEKGDTLKKFDDLEGKTIVAAGQGTTVEYILSVLLSDCGVAADIIWTSEHAETVTRALSGDADIVLLPEPMVTNLLAKSGDYRVAVSLTDVWDALGKGVLPMGGFAVRKDFLEKNPAAVQNFIKEYGDSASFINKNPAEGAAFAEKFDIIAASVAEKAIPRCNMVWLTGDGAKIALGSFFDVLYEIDPSSVGGAVPDGAFYS